MRTAQRGVTLVEMMVVVAIIGVLALLAVSVPGRGYGATPKSASDQLVSTLGVARMRAGSTRRVHRVEILSNAVNVYQSPTTGLVAPTTGWQLVQTYTLKSGVTIWNAQSGALVSPGASPAQNASLAYDVIFKPDGRATASTVFITDRAQSSRYRVLVYHATGGSYARESW